MDSNDQQHKLTKQQQRILKLLFKFRFVSAGLLADSMDIRRVGVYKILEQLVLKGLVTKVYKPEFRIDRKPAYYYLNKQGTTTVRKLMDVKESVVHALYKNNEVSEDFIEHSLKLVQCYVSIRVNLPPESEIFSKTEINRIKAFPKNRPDLYIRTPEGREAIIVIADDNPPYIVRKRLDEIITHSEDAGWEGEQYPVICFILKDSSTKYSFLYTTHKKLEGMGMDEGELPILAGSIKDFQKPNPKLWSNPYKPKDYVGLYS